MTTAGSRDEKTAGELQVCLNGELKATLANEVYFEGMRNGLTDVLFVFQRCGQSFWDWYKCHSGFYIFRLNVRNGHGGVGLCHASDSRENVSRPRELWSGDSVSWKRLFGKVM